jgi:integrase
MSRSQWPKIRERTARVKGKTYQYWVLDLGIVDGKRKFLNFRTLAEAQKEGEKKRIERNKIGNDARRLSEEHKRDAAKAVDTLKGCASLTAAAEFFIKHHAPLLAHRTVNDLMKEFISAKKASGRRPRTIQNLEYRIGKFATTFGNKKLQEISTHDIEDWFNKNEYSGMSRRNFRTALLGFFNYAVKRGFLFQNVAIALENPILDESTPEILTCGEVEKLLETALMKHPEMIPYFAIAIFAGLRPTEVQQLEWSSIDFEDKLIRVTPQMAKKRRQRLVDMSDNLIAWLQPYRQTEGSVHYSRQQFEQIRRLSRVRWVADIMRHTFASYQLAKCENTAKTCLQMGHRDPDVLFNHYRGLVKRQDAETFWQILPQKS